MQRVSCCDALQVTICMLVGHPWAPRCYQAPFNARIHTTEQDESSLCTPLVGKRFRNHASRVASLTKSESPSPEPCCLVLAGASIQAHI